MDTWFRRKGRKTKRQKKILSEEIRVHYYLIYSVKRAGVFKRSSSRASFFTPSGVRRLGLTRAQSFP